MPYLHLSIPVHVARPVSTPAMLAHFAPSLFSMFFPTAPDPLQTCFFSPATPPLPARLPTSFSTSYVFSTSRPINHCTALQLGGMKWRKSERRLSLILMRTLYLQLQFIIPPMGSNFSHAPTPGPITTS